MFAPVVWNQIPSLSPSKVEALLRAARAYPIARWSARATSVGTGTRFTRRTGRRSLRNGLRSDARRWPYRRWHSRASRSRVRSSGSDR